MPVSVVRLLNKYMKQLLPIVIALMMIFPACHKSDRGTDPADVKHSNGIITGRDLRKCACCWGWIIEIDNATYKFEKVPAGSPIDLNNLVYPAAVNISWRNPRGNCGYPMIEVVSISQ